MRGYVFFLFLMIPMILPAQSAKEDSLLHLIDVKPEEELPFIYNELASIKSNEEKFRESAHWAELALKLSEKYNLPVEQYYANYNLSFVHYHTGIIDTSIFYANEALSIAKRINNTYLIARIYSHLGNAYSRIAAFDKSLHFFFESLKIVEDTIPNTSAEKTLYYKSLLLNNIGTAYKNMGQYEVALNYFSESLTNRKQLNDLNGIASCLQNIGVVYEHEKKFDTALILYQEALKIRDSLDQYSYQAELLLNIGVVYMETGEFGKSEKQLNEAAEIFREVDRKRLLVVSYLKLAGLKLKTGGYDSAFSYLSKSIAISKKHNYKIYERDAYNLLSQFYTAKGEYEKALESRNLQMTLTDSVFSAEMATQVAELKARYETERMEKEIDILSKENEIKQLKIERKSTLVYILIIVAVVFVLLLVVAVLLLNRRRLRQKQINSELEKSKLLEHKLKEENEHQSKQLTTHALNMLQKNKLLQELDSDLRSFSPRADDGLKKKIGDIRRQINRNMNSEKDWELFRLYFEDVNDTFFNTLQNQSTELTSGDLKLAALIRLNLNIKEAAALLNISPDSLRKARYRLRKKLGLNERENLADYLGRIA
ncbi:MAG: tetratricopeptide repeat protein [Bacteroidales bacterium]|nr:tetratricopeptide repeat protein [Bacteroidales bacterium]